MNKKSVGFGPFGGALLSKPGGAERGKRRTTKKSFSTLRDLVCTLEELVPPPCKIAPSAMPADFLHYFYQAATHRGCTVQYIIVGMQTTRRENVPCVNNWTIRNDIEVVATLEGGIRGCPEMMSSGLT